MAWLDSFLQSIAPEGRQFNSSVPFEADEHRWFQAGVEQNEFRFGTCITSCPRMKRWKRAGSDEFLTPNGKPRHIFGFVRKSPGSCILAREYIPPIAAVSRLLIEKSFDRKRFSFSRYRTFSRDLIRKKHGGGYETDAEFYDSQNTVYLQIEAKKSRRETDALAKQIDSVGEWGAMPERHRKELEYVLDLRPRYLWLVGPGLIDPEQYVYEVQVDAVNACFTRVTSLPKRPG